MRQRILDRLIFQLTIAMFLAFTGFGVAAAPIALDTTSASNGIYEIYSVTFDGPVAPCGPTSPSYCSFFQNGSPPPAPPAVRALAITPNPTGVIDGVPIGFGQVPASGSFLDLTLGGGNTSLTLAGGTISFPNFTITIIGETVVHPQGAGMVFNATPQTVAVDPDGVAIFLVDLSPAVAVDFSTFSVIVPGPYPGPSCSGSLCSLIPLLTLDMVRYRLFVDYDPTFTSFTANYIGQTANNSFVYANMNSVPLPAAGWLVGTALGFTGLFIRKRRP